MPAQMQQDRIVTADVLRQPPVAFRLPCLPLQRLVLAFERFDNIVEPAQIGFRRAEPQLRLVPPGMQASDTGRFLQQDPPFGRFRADQGADAALADHGCGMGPAGQIGE